MTAVDIVYTSCHDAVRGHAGPCERPPAPSLCPRWAAGPVPSPQPGLHPPGAREWSPTLHRGGGGGGLNSEALGRGQRSLQTPQAGQQLSGGLSWRGAYREPRQPCGDPGSWFLGQETCVGHSPSLAPSQGHLAHEPPLS